MSFWTVILYKGMICILDRQQIAEGVFFSAITDKRYKTNRITVNFYTDIDDSESRSDYAAAAYILTESCKKYPTHKALSEVLLDLYDAGLTSSTTISHATQRCSTVSGAVLDDRYALNGEELVKQLSEVLCMCIFDPLTNGEAFDKTASDLMKGELLDTIDSVINDHDPIVLPHEALVVSKILEAIYESSKTGKPVYFE